MLNEKKIISYWRKKLSKYVNINDSKVLELGCGEGVFGKIISKNLVKSYIGVDPNRKRISTAKQGSPKNAIFKVGKAEKIPSKDLFDVIFFTFSWHFISDFKKALSEIKRTLKEDGIIVIIEPNKLASNWRDNRLNKKSIHFSEKIYRQKVQALERAEKVLHTQKYFKIIEEKTNQKTKPSLWILSRDSFNTQI